MNTSVEKRRESYKRWYQKMMQSNPDKHRERKKKWKKANPEKVRLQNRRYDKAHPDKVRAMKSRWKKAHPDNACMENARRRARNHGAIIRGKEAIAKVYARCQELRKWFDVHVDHIIPFDLGGTHEASNLQIIYGFENRRKHKLLDYKPRVIFH